MFIQIVKTLKQQWDREKSARGSTGDNMDTKEGAASMGGGAAAIMSRPSKSSLTCAPVSSVATTGGGYGKDEGGGPLDSYCWKKETELAKKSLSTGGCSSPSYADADTNSCTVFQSADTWSSPDYYDDYGNGWDEIADILSSCDNVGGGGGDSGFDGGGDGGGGNGFGGLSNAGTAAAVAVGDTKSSHRGDLNVTRQEVIDLLSPTTNDSDSVRNYASSLCDDTPITSPSNSLAMLGPPVGSLVVGEVEKVGEVGEVGETAVTVADIARNESVHELSASVPNAATSLEGSIDVIDLTCDFDSENGATAAAKPRKAIAGEN